MFRVSCCKFCLVDYLVVGGFGGFASYVGFRLLLICFAAWFGVGFVVLVLLSLFVWLFNVGEF